MVNMICRVSVVVENCLWLFKLVVLGGYRVINFDVPIADDSVEVCAR